MSEVKRALAIRSEDNTVHLVVAGRLGHVRKFSIDNIDFRHKVYLATGPTMGRAVQ